MPSIYLYHQIICSAICIFPFSKAQWLYYCLYSHLYGDTLIRRYTVIVSKPNYDQKTMHLVRHRTAHKPLFCQTLRCWVGLGSHTGCLRMWIVRLRTNPPFISCPPAPGRLGSCRYPPRWLATQTSGILRWGAFICNRKFIISKHIFVDLCKNNDLGKQQSPFWDVHCTYIENSIWSTLGRVGLKITNISNIKPWRIKQRIC